MEKYRRGFVFTSIRAPAWTEKCLAHLCLHREPVVDEYRSIINKSPSIVSGIKCMCLLSKTLDDLELPRLTSFNNLGL